MGNIREERGKNKQVYRVQLYDRRMIVKQASQSSWVIDQAKREIKYGAELDIEGVSKLLINCPLQELSNICDNSNTTRLSFIIHV